MSVLKPGIAFTPVASPSSGWTTLRVAVVALLALIAAGEVVAQESANVWENTREGVQYVGSEQCIECHRDQHGSYLKTTHSVATTLTDPKSEPKPATLMHPVLDERFEVKHTDDKMLHREVVLGANGSSLMTTEQQIDFTVGSGQHAKSYLFRQGDYWGQSPLTWYEDPTEWQMSPGFEGPNHPSFHRKIDTECVFCHVGSIDRKDGNPYLFELVETTIGCERCHGPGELHVKKYREDPDASGPDYTIVNPDRLSRELAESICQQCHLQGVSWIATTGNDAWDFRPGMPITDIRVDYQFSLGGDEMRIVGHVEQMHASECYKQTETLTCTTCHDPHNPIPREQRISNYRETCWECHEDESCGKPIDDRMRLAGNNCYQCHMPKAETNVTHAAFHNHEIGIFPKKKSSQEPAELQLVPILDVSRLTERERQRCLSLAQVLTLRGQPSKPEYQHFGFAASESLIRLKNSGPVDAVSDIRLALLAIAQNQREIAENLATETLAKEPRPTIAHIEAVSLLARMAFQDGNKDKAVELYRQAASYHRDAADYYYLGLCESNVGNIDAAIRALEESLEINPLQMGPHQALDAIYRARNQPDRATVHADVGKKIVEFMQRQRQKQMNQ